MKTSLRLVETPEDVLPGLLEEKAALETALRVVDALVAEQGRELARIRGVGFIRVEAIKREFGR